MAADGVGAALRAAVDEAKAGDAMAGVDVIMPSGASANFALNDMASNGGTFNVRFVTLEHFAHQLTDAADGLGRLGGVAMRELVRMVAATARPPLNDYEPGVLARSLPAVFDDLSYRSGPEVERISEVSQLTAELVRLYSEFRQLIDGRYNYSSDSLQQATQVVAGGADCSAVVALVVEPPNAYETALYSAVSERNKLQVVAVTSGVSELDSTLAPWLWGLGESHQVGQTSVQPVDKIVIAPDADAEVQVAIAELLRQGEAGVAFSRMGLIYSAQNPYGRIVEDQMRLAGVGLRGSASLKLSQSVAGGFIVRLFDVIDSNFSYQSVSNWLLALNIDGAADWLRMARRAKVSGAPSTWVERLQLFGEEQQRRHGNSDSGSDASASVAFAAFVDGLAGFLSEEHTTWQGWAEWLQFGLERYLGSHGARGEWPMNEQQLAVRIESRIARIAHLDTISSSATRDRFMEAVRDDLSSHNIGGEGARESL